MKLFIAASFASIFITTIDTWLIGILQYSSNSKKLNGFKASTLLLFGVSISSALVANYISASSVYIIGLFLFPFLFLNALLFLGKINTRLHSYKGSLRYICGWMSGLITTLIMIIAYWRTVEDMAPHIIFVSMVIQITVFVASPVIIKNK